MTMVDINLFVATDGYLGSQRLLMLKATGKTIFITLKLKQMKKKNLLSINDELFTSLDQSQLRQVKGGKFAPIATYTDAEVVVTRSKETGKSDEGTGAPANPNDPD